VDRVGRPLAGYHQRVGREMIMLYHALSGEDDALLGKRR
jgi:hypothetical protein